MRKLFSLFAALTLSVGLWAETVNVSYLYPEYNDGGFTKGIKEWKTTTVDATVVTSSSSVVYWTAGWYVVNSNVTLSKGAICNDGDVHLILANGATLTATGENDDEEEINSPGIAVTTDASLTIYGQSTNSEEMGTLNATGGYHCAGIGSGLYDFSSPLHDGGNCGSITINGGKINANGGNNSRAAIGANSQLLGYITINGGVVTANSNNKSSAGIGGYHAETIVINGGTITATNGQVGIGGEIANLLIINDGTVTATSSVVGIGGKSTTEDITINGGAITATGTGTNGIGIGAPTSNYQLAPFDITINGGTVTANGGNAGVGIGDQCESGYAPYGANIVINGGTVTATSGADGDAIGGIKHDGIYISDAYVLYAGIDKDNTTVIPHSSAQNLGGTLTQQYAKVQGLATPYTRTMSIDQWATVCLPYEATGFSGATFYKLNYFDQVDKLYIEPVDNLVAGMPYIFQATADVVVIEHADATLTYGDEQTEYGLHGSFARTIITSGGNLAALSSGTVMIAELAAKVTVPACRAYFDMSEVPTMEQPHSAPLRCIGVPRQTPTGLEVQNAQCTMHDGKFLINGQFVIIKDNKMYNAQGQMIQ